ncbi:LacI family transcriptional regulator [Pedobacter sp. W3I1]|uniref:LacI family DNA-binding transcriptional regulator n=1 Tax=Pedobacter sp. W3I1 TaxID=3042291 RepID=UPI0027829904|nr:LacI family DNA-binding transcriptional regulator [Pedobacter sp. W3I1]MDQ0639680.1 LacI family transcriptional regulator [Pedobacter sp. W3I1]
MNINFTWPYPYSQKAAVFDIDAGEEEEKSGLSQFPAVSQVNLKKTNKQIFKDMAEAVNIKRLAQELNISIATVSKALNDSYEISLKTKNRVWALAKELNYTPNPAASNLRSHKTKTIAVVIPCVANNFFSLSIKGIEEIARQYGYHVLIYQTHENIETEVAFTNSLLNGRVDGILTSVSSSEYNSEYYANLVKKIPLVFFDRVYENLDAVKVTTDDYEIAFQATEHLIECGCTKIAYLYGLENLPAGKARFAGYLDALKAHGIAAKEQLGVKYQDDEELNLQNIKALLGKYKPDALFSSIEEFIIPAYCACKELNLKIPDDVKILSFSNLSTAKLLNPSLTTISQPAFEIGREAAKCLFKILNNKQLDDEQNIVLKSVLIKRESTSC